MIIWVAVALLSGLYIGSLLTDQKWKDNRYQPSRVLHRRRFYKVVLLESPTSWEMLDIHRYEENNQ